MKRRVRQTRDWPRIVALYGALMRLSDNPMVALNHAVAVAMAQGPAEGLALLERLDRDPRIKPHYRLDAVRGHLLERSGAIEAALTHYKAAAEKTASIPERDYLLLENRASACKLGPPIRRRFLISFSIRARPESHRFVRRRAEARAWH